MRRLLSIVVFMVVWSVVTILAVTYGVFYNWPDYVHTDYGFPSTWATHTTSTFAGPANLWTVDTIALIVDLTVWLAVMVVIVAAIYLFLGRARLSDKT
jgi:hypothetical protein